MASSFTSTVVVAGSSATAVQYNNLRQDVLQMAGDYSRTTGTGNVYTLAIDAQLSAYSAGQVFKFRANFANTSTAVLAVNGLASKSLVKGALGLDSGDISSGQAVVALYDGTNMQMLSRSARDRYSNSNGSDGDFVLNASQAAVSGIFGKSGSTFTLLKDAQFGTLQIDSGFILETNGYILWVIAVQNDGTIQNNGGNGGNGGLGATSGGTAGAAAAGATLAASKAGTAGGTGHAAGGSDVGASAVGGTSANPSLGVNGSAGGVGGPGTFLGGTSGAGAATLETLTVKNYDTVVSLTSTAVVTNNDRLIGVGNSSSVTLSPSAGSGGGGGGAYDGDASGGGGGAGGGGGNIEIIAQSISNTGTIQVKGGNGGNGGNATNLGSPGGGGAGGAGGVMLLIYQFLTNSGTISVAGGTKGTKGTYTGAGPGSVGADGSDGLTGRIYKLLIS